jgi:polyhydroxyalkanoate synthesis regulator phasin
MSIVNDLKKLLFGAKATASSAAEKGKEAAQDLAASSSELLDDLLTKAENAGQQATEKANDLWEQIQQSTTTTKADASEKPNYFADLEATNPDHQPESKVEALGKTVLDTAEKVGHTVIEKGGEALHKVMDTAEQIGEKVLKAGEEGGEILKEKAKTIGQHWMDKATELMDKAEEEAAQDTTKEAFTDAPIDTKDSLFEKHNSFFEKAARFAEDKPVITKEGDKKKSGHLKGFEDKDGDGDDLIDDAIIES